MVANIDLSSENNLNDASMRGAASFLTATSFLLGSLLTVLSLPVLVAGTALGLGGSLVVIAGKKPAQENQC